MERSPASHTDIAPDFAPAYDDNDPNAVMDAEVVFTGPGDGPGKELVVAEQTNNNYSTADTEGPNKVYDAEIVDESAPGVKKEGFIKASAFDSMTEAERQADFDRRNPGRKSEYQHQRAADEADFRADTARAEARRGVVSEAALYGLARAFSRTAQARKVTRETRTKNTTLSVVPEAPQTKETPVEDAEVVAERRQQTANTLRTMADQLPSGKSLLASFHKENKAKLESAIEAAEQGDFRELDAFGAVLQDLQTERDKLTGKGMSPETADFIASMRLRTTYLAERLKSDKPGTIAERTKEYLTKDDLLSVILNVRRAGRNQASSLAA